MPSAALNVPDQSALLCEGCGYILSGLSSSRCPECGREIENSLPRTRTAPVWETPGLAPARWLATTIELIFHPARFYRSLPTRANTPASRRYARINCLLVALLLGFTGYFHFQWLELSRFIDRRVLLPDWALAAGCTLFFAVLTYVSLKGVTWIASRLTAWEAAYRGLRLPHPVVVRGLHYHSAHYLPVALAAFTTVGGYRLAIQLGYLSAFVPDAYAYFLCALVVASAGYLFKTYWIGMKNMMFANR